MSRVRIEYDCPCGQKAVHVEEHELDRPVKEFMTFMAHGVVCPDAHCPWGPGPYDNLSASRVIVLEDDESKN